MDLEEAKALRLENVCSGRYVVDYDVVGAEWPLHAFTVTVEGTEVMKKLQRLGEAVNVETLRQLQVDGVLDGTVHAGGVLETPIIIDGRTVWVRLHAAFWCEEEKANDTTN